MTFLIPFVFLFHSFVELTLLVGVCVVSETHSLGCRMQMENIFSVTRCIDTDFVSLLSLDQWNRGLRRLTLWLVPEK